jgi:hypothetical protein
MDLGTFDGTFLHLQSILLPTDTEWVDVHVKLYYIRTRKRALYADLLMNAQW